MKIKIPMPTLKITDIYAVHPENDTRILEKKGRRLVPLAITQKELTTLVPCNTKACVFMFFMIYWRQPYRGGRYGTKISSNATQRRAPRA